MATRSQLREEGIQPVMLTPPRTRHSVGSGRRVWRSGILQLPCRALGMSGLTGGCQEREHLVHWLEVDLTKAKTSVAIRLAVAPLGRQRSRLAAILHGEYR